MQLSAIRQLARDWADVQAVPTSGKYSDAWWNRQINYVKDVLAQETGYYVIYHPLSVTANVPTIALPSTLCWGIISVLFWNDQIEARSLFDLAQEHETWRDTVPGTVEAYSIVGSNLELYPAPTRTVTSAGTLLAATAGGGFTNQPANDAVEVVSASALDTTQTVTIYGTSYLTGTLVSETVTLAGTAAVTTDKDDWGDILGVTLSAACAGNVTVREASGDATITTISAGGTSAGVTAATDGDAGKAQPLVAASSTSGAVVGVLGTDADGSSLTDNCVALSGVAAATRGLPKRMDSVTYALLGAVPAAQTVTLTRGAALQILAGALPADMSGDTDTPTGLPGQFHQTLAHGAAAMATLSDIYDQSNVARSGGNIEAFWRGAQRLSEYMNWMQKERLEAYRMGESLWEHYYR